MAINLDEIIQKNSQLEVYEKRSSTPEYGEIVVLAKDLAAWEKIFTELFGPAVKPAGSALPKEYAPLVKPFGGVNDDQILFVKNSQGVTVIAMFWPWQNKQQVTLKLIHTQGAPSSEPAPKGFGAFFQNLRKK